MDSHETRIYVGRLEEGRPEVYAVGSAERRAAAPGSSCIRVGHRPRRGRTSSHGCC